MQHLIGDVHVSRETMDRLRTFEALTRKWQRTINLVSNDTLPDLWERHILDSAQIFHHFAPPSGPWLDIGSGGGFPGIVAAIMRNEQQPGETVTLVESDIRKATFLRTALRECDVPGRVLAERVENIAPRNDTILTARALAPISDLLQHAERHLASNGTALLHKGRNYAKELDDARKIWSYDIRMHISLTAPDSRLLEIRNISRANAQ